MKEFVLENFNKQTIKSLEVGAGATDFYHRIATNFPLWKSGINAGELAPDKNDAFYPLIPSIKENSVSLGTTYGYVNSLTYPLTSFSNGDVYVITTKGNVLGIDSSGVITNFGQPVIDNNVCFDLTTFNGKVVVAPPNATTIYYKNEDNTGSWTSAGSLTSCRFVEPFAGWLLVGDRDGDFSRLRYIKIFNTSFVEQTPAFDIGKSVEIVDFRNINDLFVAIIARNFNNGKYFVYVWDGTPGSSYIKSIPLLGKYRGMKMVGNSWYIVTHFMGSIYIYEYNGLSVGLKKEIAGARGIFLGGWVGKPMVAALGSFLVVPIRITGESNYHLLFYDVINDTIALSRVSNGGDFSYGLCEAVNYSIGYDYLILFTSTETLVKTILLNTNSDPSYYFSSSLLGEYQSNWINLGNIVIRAIEIFYDGKPDTGGSISVNLETKNEYARIDYSSVSIGSITNSDNKHRKIFSGLGYTCNKFRIKLAITHGGTDNWSGAVKKIVVHYELTNRKI